MVEYAPDSLIRLGQHIAQAIPGGKFSGVIGDAAHTYGYHRARTKLPANDYSVQLANDKTGDKWAASAVDVSFPEKSQQLVTRRLLDAAKAKDKRLYALREFFGSLDSKNVRGFDLAKHVDSNGADDSHLWHVHLSIYRRYANDAEAVAGILSVIKGEDEVSAKDIWDYRIPHSSTTHKIEAWKDEKDKTAASWLRSMAYHSAKDREETAALRQLVAQLEQRITELETK